MQYRVVSLLVTNTLNFADKKSKVQDSTDFGSHKACDKFKTQLAAW